MLGPRTESADKDTEAANTAGGLDIHADSDEARRLIDYGLAELVDGAVTLTDQGIRQVVARSGDPLLYVRVLLRIVEATRDAIDGLANGFVHVLQECLAARFGQYQAPGPDEMDELSQVVRDYRDLWNSVVSGRLDSALHEVAAAAVPRPLSP